VDILADSADVRDPHPARKQLTITVLQPGVSLGQVPGVPNDCGPVRLINDTKGRVDKIEFQWEIVAK
jgi:hypothetical protein